jgi:FdrA protein
VIVRSTVRRSAYNDSVALLRAQEALRRMPGVDQAGVVMGTEANLDLLRQAGLDPGDIAVGAGDLVVVIRGDTAAHVEAALAAVDALLAHRETAGPPGEEYRPRTVYAAARMLPGASLALISVPGRFAAGAASEALAAGLHVMLFSDNVSVQDEVRLKRIGRERGRLVMGPDCGTALIGGAALGFANRVRRGAIGLVAASGTGLQEVAAIVHRGGGGISHAIGTGGRDLGAAVGGIAAEQGLAMLGRDPQTAVIVVVSKPPEPAVAARLAAQASILGQPTVIVFPGAPDDALTMMRGPVRASGDAPVTAAGAQRLLCAQTLEGAARLALRLAGGCEDPRDADERWRCEVERRARDAIARLASSQRYLRGLYSGGTLCAECVGLLQTSLRPLCSNVPTGAVQRHEGARPSRAHTILDLGDDVFTVGRLHPMLDMTLRAERLRQEAADPEVAVLVLDVVLGYGVHPDPAGALAPAIEAGRAEAAKDGRHLAVVASVCGTDDDPQGRSRQVARLEAAGVLVEESNARAALLAGMIASREAVLSQERSAMLSQERSAMLSQERSALPPWTDRHLEDVLPSTDPHGLRAGSEATLSRERFALLVAPPRVVNVGLEIFADSLREQGVAVIDVDWRPPAGGDAELAALLERLQ